MVIDQSRKRGGAGYKCGAYVSVLVEHRNSAKGRCVSACPVKGGSDTAQQPHKTSNDEEQIANPA